MNIINIFLSSHGQGEKSLAITLSEGVQVCRQDLQLCDLPRWVEKSCTYLFLPKKGEEVSGMLWA